MNFERIIEFVREHRDEDPLKLLLQQKKYPDVDMTMVAQQIEGQRQASAKWPTLAGCEGFLYPPRLNREQSSSEDAAVHKAEVFQNLFGNGRRLNIADLTGGMGIDSIAFAKTLDSDVDYVECDAGLCQRMEHNTNALGLSNVTVHCGDGIEWLRDSGQRYDIIYVDPARRDTHGKKVAAFEDCTPNILEHRELLAERCDFLVVKASPMMDIDKGIEQLVNVGDVYVVAVKNECKELVFVCGHSDDEPRIHCHHMHHDVVDDLVFTRQEETQAKVAYAADVKKYLYEPNAALMKAGPFKLLSQREGVEKLARNTHLYTSDSLLQNFPGRTFGVIVETCLNSKEVKRLIPDGKAHVVTRNYPVAAADLQRQLRLKEGGDLFVIATTIGTKKTGFICCLQKNY
ncbi:MAG: class I SAM-dependent methyltransferase [Bacteroidales bacterium]|nr:class I SAM-dependent methyltransferase [Bacteroidales bacterium]